MASRLEYLKLGLFEHRTVGSLTQSSRYVAKKIIAELQNSNAQNIVEYGPGDGVITKQLLKQLPKNVRIVSIELNDFFYAELQQIKDPRLTIIHGDVVEYARKLKSAGLPRVDAVISNIPCSHLSVEQRNRVVRDTHHSLAPGGIFIIFQYSPFFMLPTLKKFFPRVRTQIEPRNFPPNFFMIATK